MKLSGASAVAPRANLALWYDRGALNAPVPAKFVTRLHQCRSTCGAQISDQTIARASEYS
jgi:hypothetical protein